MTEATNVPKMLQTKAGHDNFDQIFKPGIAAFIASGSGDENLTNSPLVG